MINSASTKEFPAFHNISLHNGWKMSYIILEYATDVGGLENSTGVLTITQLGYVIKSVLDVSGVWRVYNPIWCLSTPQVFIDPHSFGQKSQKYIVDPPSGFTTNRLLDQMCLKCFTWRFKHCTGLFTQFPIIIGAWNISFGDWSIAYGAWISYNNA